VPETHYSTTVATLIYDSRNAFSIKAITEGYDRVLFLDSDMVFSPDLLETLSADMDTGLDYVSGLFFCRRFPIKPMIYSKAEVGRAEDGAPMAITESYMDYPKNQLFEIHGSGFGAVLIRTELLRKVWDAYGPPFMPTPIMGEDLAFCVRAREVGAKLYCDSRVKAGHIGQYIFDEDVYIDRWKTEQAMQRMKTEEVR
jgi:GT2 family glycosyltransferase